MSRKAKGYSRADRHQTKMAGLLDELQEFEKFREEVLPALRKMIDKGASAEEIYAKYQAHAAARAVTTALTETDSSKALAAIKEVLDRSGGKAKERSETTHKYQNLKDEQLDALLKTEIEEMPEEDLPN